MRKIVPVMCAILLASLLVPVFGQQPDDTQPPGYLPSMPKPPSDSRLDQLAAQEYRPGWAPVPILWGDPDGWRPHLVRWLASSDPLDRALSAFLLGQVGGTKSIDALAPLLEDPDHMARLQAGIALAILGDARGIQPCAYAIDNEAPWLGYYGVFGIWRTHAPAAGSQLLIRLDVPHPLVRTALTGALRSRYVEPPKVEDAPPTKKELSPAEVWHAAAEAFKEESGWWWQKKDVEQSIRCLEVCTFLEPGDMTAYASIAWMLFGLGRDADAILTLQRAVTAAPKDAQAHFNLGAYYLNTKRADVAEEALRNAVELGGAPLHRRVYADDLERNGKLYLSLQQWEALVSADPNDASARKNLDRIQRRLNSQRLSEGYM